LTIKACDRAFVIQCEDEEAAALIARAFSGLISATASIDDTFVLCRVLKGPAGWRFRVLDSRGGDEAFDDADGLVFHLDKLLTLTLQYQRPDLYFLHAAAIALDGRVVVLAAPAGTGKSTLTFALVHSGFSYLSDELAPVDIRTVTVHPYPHALCLKSPPPQPYRLPPDTLGTGHRFHVPVAALPAVAEKDQLPLAAIFFVQRAQTVPAVCRSVTAARAAARLMSNALNPLAHNGDGLDAAVAISQTVPCFELESSNLQRAQTAIEAILQRDALHSAIN
jgi:hypothetical protein